MCMSFSVCPALKPKDFAPTPHPQNKGTCSTGLETGCKPVLFWSSSSDCQKLNK